MSRLTIKVHESKISRMRNQDAFEEWLHTCWNNQDNYPWFAEMCTYNEGPVGPNGEHVDITNHTIYFIDSPSKGGKNKAKINARLDAIKSETEKLFFNLPGVRGLTEYLDYIVDVIEEDYLVELMVNPKDSFWDLDLDDAKYIYTKANKAIYQASMNKYTIDYFDKKFPI